MRFISLEIRHSRVEMIMKFLPVKELLDILLHHLKTLLQNSKTYFFKVKVEKRRKVIQRENICRYSSSNTLSDEKKKH
jgi:hypothetical protein